jgi:hypothetical protein
MRTRKAALGVQSGQGNGRWEDGLMHFVWHPCRRNWAEPRTILPQRRAAESDSIAIATGPQRQ